MRLTLRRAAIKDRGEARHAGESPRIVARRLHAWAAAAARAPSLYAEMGVSDDTQGRYEALTAFVILLIERLGPTGAPGQALFDTYIGDLDGALRELGVGDLAIAKRMKGLGRNFYGRAAAWREALGALPNQEPLDALLARTMAPKAGAARRAVLARHLLAARQALASANPLDRAFGSTTF